MACQPCCIQILLYIHKKPPAPHKQSKVFRAALQIGSWLENTVLTETHAQKCCSYSCYANMLTDRWLTRCWFKVLTINQHSHIPLTVYVKTNNSALSPHGTSKRHHTCTVDKWLARTCKGCRFVDSSYHHHSSNNFVCRTLQRIRRRRSLIVLQYCLEFLWLLVGPLSASCWKYEDLILILEI